MQRVNARLGSMQMGQSWSRETPRAQPIEESQVLSFE